MPWALTALLIGIAATNPVNRARALGKLPAAPGELSVSLTDSIFLETQPVYAIVCIRNTTDSLLPNLASMRPDAPWFTIWLQKDGDSNRIRPRLPDILYARGPGVPVPPRGVYCNVLNLGGMFGSGGWYFPGRRPPGGTVAEFSSLTECAHLGPGHYTFYVADPSRPIATPEFPGDFVPTASIDFEVRALDSDSSEAARLGRFVAEGPWLQRAPPGTSPFAPRFDYCHDRTREFAGSRHFFAIFYGGLPRHGEFDRDSLFRWNDPSGRDDAKSALLLHLLIKVADWSKPPDPAGLAPWHKYVRGPIGEAVFESYDELGIRTRLLDSLQELERHSH